MFGPERYDLTGYYSFSSTQTPGCDRDPFVTMNDGPLQQKEDRHDFNSGPLPREKRPIGLDLIQVS